MDELFSRIPFLETILWILAVIAAFAAFLIVVPGFLNNSASQPSNVAQATLTPRATLTPIVTATSVQSAPPPRPQTPQPLPTPPPNARLFTFVADPKRSGWLATGETSPHWGDRNLHAGVYQGQTYRSVIYFDLSVFAPGTRILFAQVELTGLNRNNLGAHGQWTLDLLPDTLLSNWTQNSNSDFANTPADATIGAPLAPADLVEGQANPFTFSSDQLARLEADLNQTGPVAFRLVGPTSGGDSLFTWDGGDPDPAVGAHPTLRVIAIPGQFVPITNTPTPQNVLTAAAQYVQATNAAQQFGTPTPLPRQYATFVPYQVITPLPTPANTATAQAQAAYATAMAMTTGTFTPTPRYWGTATPTPAFIALGQFTPVPTSSPTVVTEISRLQQIQTPLPTGLGLRGNILFLTDREGTGTPQVWVMNPQGAPIGKLNGEEYYQIAATQELFSRDKLFQVDVGKDSGGQWDVVILDVAKGILSPLITEDPKKRVGAGSYNPAWSPTANQIAFVSERSGTGEIYSYDLSTGLTRRLTYTPQNPTTLDWATNNHPSWSPDGHQIVFASNRDPFPRWQIWIMNADGSNMHRLSTSPSNDTAPIWVK